jgi:branched-chain amino acid transport system ATP-binding protein
MSSHDAILLMDHVTRRFQGLVAVDDVSVELRKGEVLGLIGPNGAGKTTLFNLISGACAPTTGTIRFNGRDVTHQPPYVVARAGIARTHQIVQPLKELSVRDNVAVGACFGRRNLPLGQAYAVAENVLNEVGLTSQSDLPAGKLNIAQQKRLELARALAGEPFVLLLDEVLAGLNPLEVAGMVEVIRRIHARGIDVIMVEHIMQAIMSLCDRVIVLESGRKIADGPAQIVANDSAVVTAYLGDSTLVHQLQSAR